MPEQIVYMDYNATTRVDPAVAEAVAASFSLYGNASSMHSAGRTAAAAVERARAQTAALLGADPQDSPGLLPGPAAGGLSPRLSNIRA